MRQSSAPPLLSNIGGVCASTRMTHRAVRYYEERGLIAVKRDSYNRRLYDQAGRRRLQLIASLRRAGLSLEDIREILDCESEAARASLIVDKVQVEIHRYEALVAKLVAMMDEFRAGAIHSAAA